MWRHFQGPHAQPTFNFNNLLDLVQDKPFTETAVAYNPIYRQARALGLECCLQDLWPFAQDTWNVKPNLTLTYGIRFDNYGNPYSRV